MNKKKFIPGKTKVQYAGAYYDNKEVDAMIKSIKKGWFGVGEKADKFEKEFAQFIGVKNAIVTNSGSSATLLAVAGFGFKPGLEIITPACNFPTSFNPIVQLGLVPVLIDVDLGTYNIKAELIEKAITKKTVALLIPHTLGNPCNMKKIMKIKKKYNLKLIEDNCDALGSTYNNQKTGSFGDVATCSFYPAHHITIGEGGMVYLNSNSRERKIRSLRDWGRACHCKWDQKNPHGACKNRFNFQLGDLPKGYDHRYTYTSIGYNLKPVEFQCAMGLEQLKKLPFFVKKRRQNFTKLYNYFKKFEKYFILPKWEKEAKPSWFSFPLTVKDKAPFSRRDISIYLEDHNIQTRPLFAGNIIRHPAYKNVKYRISGSLKNSDKILLDTFFIGVWPGMDDEQIGYIKKTVNKFFKQLY
ncbi:lipopolysaccharide biosynthesis protein RfbH [Patescibacteria group bacterium]|nr:lipopolysaccharide biosynthesis protein RfbH [Patescibacteria group bacterium]MBU0963423.1 lipopolysaccharide biosynthesis protein RfbH [Patescibacteria group bacterium]